MRKRTFWKIYLIGWLALGAIGVLFAIAFGIKELMS